MNSLQSAALAHLELARIRATVARYPIAEAEREVLTQMFDDLDRRLCGTATARAALVGLDDGEDSE